MTNVTEGLKPQKLWQYFEQICAIPHCSKNEAEIREFIRETGTRLGAEVREDSTGNLVLAVPATPGFETAPTVILQSHIDMVCEKNSDTVFDFSKDGIRPMIDGEWLTADGTTLGADNGIGVAAELAMLESPDVEHGPLELLFTVDEETGLTGAMGLDPALLTGRIMLNLDSEEDGMLYVGCAGGTHLSSEFPLHWQDAPQGLVPLHVSLKGLKGGHSGCDIHLNHGNALKLLAELLTRLFDQAKKDNWNGGLWLASFNAGSAHNAIPREGNAILLVHPDHQQELDDLAMEIHSKLADAFPHEEDFTLNIETPEEAPKQVWSEDDVNTNLAAILAFYNGIFAMSQDIPGLVETSNSLALAQTKQDHLFVLNSTRSSNAEAMELLLKQNAAVTRLAGAKAATGDGYPGWQPNMESPVLTLARQLHKERTGNDPKITAIHAGLECGLIGERFPGMDMLSFGPEIDFPHSPDERVHIESVQNFWALLSALLSAIARGKLPA